MAPLLTTCAGGICGRAVVGCPTMDVGVVPQPDSPSKPASRTSARGSFMGVFNRPKP